MHCPSARVRPFLPLLLAAVAASLLTPLVSAQSPPGATGEEEAGQSDAAIAELEEVRRARAGTSSDPREALIDSLLVRLETEPENAALHFRLANVYHDAGYLHSALEHFNDATRIEPGDSKIWVNRGVLLKELNRHEEAIESFEKALAANPDDALAYVNLGDEYLSERKYPPAINAYRTALAIDANCAPAHYSMAIAFAETGMYREAARAWRKCAELAIEPDGKPTTTGERAAENATLMDEIIADAEKELEERERRRAEGTEGRSD